MCLRSENAMPVLEQGLPVAYNLPVRWRADDLRIVLLDEVSEGDIVASEDTVGNATLRIMGEIRRAGQNLAVEGVHISSSGLDPNELGFAKLRRISQAIMELGNCDEILVEGAVRTTGAHPGHRRGVLRFTRNRRPRPRRRTEPG